MKNVKNNQTAKRPLIPWSFKSPLMLLALVFLLAPKMQGQTFTNRLDENNLPSGYLDNREGEAAIVEFHGADPGTLICRGMFNSAVNNYELVLVAYDLGGNQMTSPSPVVIDMGGVDLVPAGACYNSNTGEYLIYGNVTNDDPWFITVDNNFTIQNQGTIPPSGTGVITITDAVSVINNGTTNDYALVGRQSTNSSNLFSGGSSLVIIELLSTVTTAIVNRTNITTLSSIPNATTYNLGADGFGTSIIEITSSSNGGYFISGRVDDAAFYLRTSYNLNTGNMRAYAIEYPGTVLNAMAACYSVDEEWLFVAGTASNSTNPMGFFFDRIDGISSLAASTPNSILPKCRSNIFTGGTAPGLPILYMDNNTLAGCDLFGNNGLPSVENISRELLVDGTVMNIVGIRLNDVDYTWGSPCTTVSSNYMLPGLIPLQGIDDEYISTQWLSTTTPNLTNMFYPRKDGNSAPTYYDIFRDLNNMYFPHKQFFTYGPNTTPTSTDQHSMIGSYTTAFGNPQEPVLIQNDNNYIENGCLSIETSDDRLNATNVYVAENSGTTSIANASSVTPGSFTPNSTSFSIVEDDCVFSSNLFKTTPTKEDGLKITSGEIAVHEAVLTWTGDLEMLSTIDIYSINGQKLKTLRGSALATYQYNGADLVNGIYVVQLTRTDKTQQTIKWLNR